MARASLFRVDSADLILLSHFFNELFESDLLSIRDRLLPVLTSILSLLAAFGLLLPILFNHKYHVLNALPTSVLYQEAGLADKLMFVCFSMDLVALGTLLSWQSLFPSTRDFLILGPLPLQRFQIFRAKLGALLLFVGILIVGVNFLPSLSLPMVMAGKWQLPTGSFLHIVSLFLACCSAGLFAFFGLLTTQAILLNLLPARLFARCSLTLQAGLLIIVLAALPLLLWIPDLHAFMLQRPVIAWWLPPAWFLAWEEQMLGRGDRFTALLAARAEWALGGSIIAGFALYALTYGRSIAQVLESRKKTGERVWALHLSKLLHLIARSPGEAALLSFLMKTLARSRIHKLLLAAIGGACFSLVVDSFVSLFVREKILHHKFRRWEWHHAALSAPLVVSFFLVCGLTYIFLLPVEPRGNWIFRIAELPDLAVTTATEKALLLVGVGPVIAGTWIGMVGWLGLLLGSIHTCFVLLMTLVLVEAVLWNWNRIPFTCPYLPGKQNLIQSSLIFGLALSSFAYFATSFEALILSSPKIFLLLLALLVVVGFMRIHRRRSWSGGILLKFDDLPEPEVYTLGLQPE